MKITTIIGARPQFVKAAPLSSALESRGIEEYRIHTGQHYDSVMSDVFFKELGLPQPHINLGIGSGSHAEQTGKALIAIERSLQEATPDAVLVYGDTNSTLAGALAATKLGIPLAHVEAGLRSFNRAMPEEHNRVLADHSSDILFCPSERAEMNLRNEGITSNVHVVGDIMFDTVSMNMETAQRKSTALDRFGLESGQFMLATIHRPCNTDSVDRLSLILSGLGMIQSPILFPVHPRTQACLDSYGLTLPPNIQATKPLGYLDMLILSQNAQVILTDSGGLQKEAYWLKTPCVTIREETEWVETVQSGWNRLVYSGANEIAEAASTATPQETHPAIYGNGDTAMLIADLLMSYLNKSNTLSTNANSAI